MGKYFFTIRPTFVYLEWGHLKKYRVRKIWVPPEIGS